MKPMSEKAKLDLAKFNAKQTDWWAVCKRCGKTIVGSLADIQKHAGECHGE